MFIYQSKTHIYIDIYVTKCIYNIHIHVVHISKFSWTCVRMYAFSPVNNTPLAYTKGPIFHKCSINSSNCLTAASHTKGGVHRKEECQASGFWQIHRGSRLLGLPTVAVIKLSLPSNFSGEATWERVRGSAK